MKTLLPSLIFIASSSSLLLASGPSLTVAIPDAKAVTVIIHQKADYVSIPITVTSDQKDPDLKFNEIRQVRDLIFSKASSDSKFIVLSGSTRLSTREISKFGSFSSGYEPVSQSELSVLLPLPKEHSDVYACASDIRAFIFSLKLPGKSQISTGWLQLVTENPEQYRQKLIQLIAADMKTTKDLLGSKATVTISGLQQPVTVRRSDETNVDIFLPYSMSISVEN